jgi:TPR repeat protein
MRGSTLLGIVYTCALWSGAPQEKPVSREKVPEHALQMVALGRQGDGLAMVDANHACEAWGVSRPFAPAVVQKALLPQAQSGNAKAMWSMGISMVRYAEPGPGSDQEKGKIWIRRAAEAGEPSAMLNMVSQVRNPEEQNQWIKRAYETLLPKAESGDVEAILELVHVPDLLRDAKNPGGPLFPYADHDKWLRKAVDLGSTDAMIMLAERLRRYQGHSREETLANRQESMELSRKLIAMGHWPTMVDIGVIYADGVWPRSGWIPTDLGPDGEKLRTNPTKAWEWWDKAIAVAGKETVMKYLLERHALGDAEQNECQQIPPRPKN